MKKERLEELEEILDRHPEILNSLHPLEQEVVVKLCKELKCRRRKAKTSKPSPPR